VGFKLAHSWFHFFHAERIAQKYFSVVTMTTVIKFSSLSQML